MAVQQVDAPVRVLPSTLPLERIISQWDFYRDIQDNTVVDHTIPLIPKARKLPPLFATSDDYVEYYEPLFLLETNNMIHRSKEQVMDDRGEKMLMRQYQRPKAGPETSAEDFLRLTLEKTEHNDRKYMTSDVVLLSLHPDPRKECETHAIAFVEGFSVSQLVVRLKIIREGDVRSRKVIAAIQTADPWYVTKIDSCSTVFREFVALRAFANLHLKGHLLLSATDNTSFMKIPEALSKTLEARFNASQLEAIHSSRKAEGITLIQGPPGTGKTSTIIGILSVLLQCKGSQREAVVADKVAEKDDSSSEDIEDYKESQAKRFKKSMPWMHPDYVGSWLDVEILSFDVKTGRQYSKNVYVPDTEVMQMWKETDHAVPQKVLVTAPSNGAVDEIIRRLLRDGLISANGGKKPARLVRCGPNVHESLQPHSLNHMATVRAKSTGSGATDQARLEKAKQQILDEAQIILATNSVAGSRDLQQYTDDFDTVVVDEASQGVELSTLIPLIAGCRRLILVGDPKQLPATVFSQAAKDCGYDRSLFQRLQESAHPVNMLNEQFRMHPQIAMFPSAMFYEGKLKSHYSTSKFEELFPAKWSTVPCFGPVAFFHVPGKEQMALQSYCNEDEADFIVGLVKTVKRLYDGDLQWIKNIGIITPYLQQVAMIRQKFKNEPERWDALIDIGTVDGFQGREKEVIILSSVRADRSKNSIGFVRDIRRMNVAFTRPRRNLWVVGQANVLKINPKWASFLDFVEDKCVRINVKKPHNTFIERWLSDYYRKNPHLTAPAGLGEYSLGDDEDLELSKEEVEAIIEEQEMNAKYKIADRDNAE